MSRVLVIPDVHLKPKIFAKAERILFSQQADFAVQMGDLVDDWGEEYNLNLYAHTLEKAVDFHCKFPETLWCMGNHDYGYHHPNMGAKESGHSMFAEGEVASWLRQMERVGAVQKVMHIVDNCIFTHAGLDRDWVSRQMDLLQIPDPDTHRLDDDTLLRIVDNASPNELWQEDSPIWARPQHQEHNMYPATLQVVGHTPVKTAAKTDGVLSTDTFSTYSNGAPFGDGRFVIVDTETGKWHYAEEGEQDGQKDKRTKGQKDPMGNALIDFFESQGFRFVDADTGEPFVDHILTVCESCHCMTRTRSGGYCAKCGAYKGYYYKEVENDKA